MKTSRPQNGAAAVEFALVLPLFLLILFGIVELSVALYDKAVITNASREAARAGIVFKTPKLSTAEIQALVRSYCAGHLITFGTSSAPTVTISGAGGDFGSPLSVTVTYAYSGLGLGTMISALTGPIDLSATTAMNNE